MESFTLGLMRGDGAPLYRQLYRHIVEEIASGGLAAGEKLPSKRRLAADLRADPCICTYYTGSRRAKRS